MRPHGSLWTHPCVERTNARGRHTYVPAFKRWIVEQSMLPGMSLAGLAMSNQVNANQLRRWVQLHGKDRPGLTTAATLLPVTVAAPQAPVPAARTIAPVPVEIELAGAVVRVRDGVAPATLRMVLACLRDSAP